MCGRARCTLRADDIPRACHLQGRSVRSLNTDRYRPAYNVAPGSYLPVIRREDGSDSQGVVIHCMKWGLVPSFTKKTERPDHYKMFNARSESITEKASFRRLIPGNRCLVAVEGFYEWKKDGSKKQPYYIHFKDGRPLVFAALYDSCRSAEGDILYTFTILTTSSSSALEWLHDRMPVILGEKECTEAWLHGSSKLDTLLKPYEQDLAWYPVTTAMGKPSFDGPECIKEIQLKTEEMKPISSFFSKKGVNSQQESKLQLKPLHPTRPATLKEEPETRDSIEGKSVPLQPTHPTVKEEPEVQDDQSFSDKGCEDSKFDVSLTIAEAAAHFHPERDYEDFSTERKRSIDDTDEPRASPVRKKGNLGSASAKQPTLFSYFGKG